MISRFVPRPDAPRHPVRGMFIYVLALLFFAAMDAFSKYLALRYPVPLVAWTRYAVHLVMMSAAFLPFTGRSLLHVQRADRVLLRAACLVGITLFMLFALRRLPLAEATSIVYIAPLLVVLLAQPLLHERIGALRLGAALIGFLGVLLVARPGGALDGVGVACAFATALCMTSYQLLTRILSHTENAAAMLYYSALLGTLVFGLSLPWFWFTQRPPMFELMLFFGLGACGFFGHLCFTLAFRDTPASRLAPVSYLQLLWSALLGWMVFDQTPSVLSIAGMCIIAVCGVVVTALGGQSQERQEG